MALWRCVSGFLRTLPRSQCEQYLIGENRLSVASALWWSSPYRAFSKEAALDPDQKPKRKVGRPRKEGAATTTKSRKKKKADLETVDDENESISRKKSVKSSKTESKSKRGTKSVVTLHNETECEENLPVQPQFPFEGTSEPTLQNTQTQGSLDIERIKLHGSRHYLVKQSHESYCFPSVTTVLDATQPPSMFFRLRNWRKSMIKEHGVAKSGDIAKGILQSGKNFHKEIEHTLLQSTREDVISIKPHITEKQYQPTTSSVIQSSTLQNAHIKRYKPTTSVPIRVKDIRSADTGEINLLQDLVETQNIEGTELSKSLPEEESAELEGTTCELPQSENYMENGEYTTEISAENSQSDLIEPTLTALKETLPDSGQNGSEMTGENGGYMKSVQHVLKDISNVHAIESVVSHMELGYTGTFDCLAEYRGELCVIDWKTSAKPKPTLADCYNNPLQAAAYAGAINQDHHYPYKVHSAVIVIVYPNGDPAHAHYLSADQLLCYWREWLEKLERYHTQFASDLTELII